MGMTSTRPEPDTLEGLREALAKRSRELDVLAEVASRVHGREDVHQILEIALDEILARFDLTSAWIFLGDDREKRLRLAAQRGCSREWLDEVHDRGLEECLCPEVFWTGHRMQARNTLQCPRMPTIVDGLREPVAHACIPLRFEGPTRGVLNVAARPGQVFSDDELRFLETLGHQVCLAIERADHLAAERRRNQEARAMAAISKAIGGSLDAKDVLAAVGRTAREVLQADRVHVLLGASPERMTVAYVSDATLPGLRVGDNLDLGALEAALHVSVLESGEPAVVEDWSADARVNPNLMETWAARSGILVPLSSRRGLQGLLAVTCETPRRFGEEEVELIEALGAQASIALENARLFEETRRALDDLKSAQNRIIQNEKMAVLGTFASGLAHEVRNPLNSIALQLSILERRTARLEEPLSSQVRDLVGIIREEICRLDGLVGDFLLLSRANRVQYRPTEMEPLLDEVVRLLRPEAREAGITIRRQRLGERLGSLVVDAEKMKQVVINLVRNALEAITETGIVTVEDGLLDGRATIVVRDTGPGLPDGVDIFQLFVTTKAKGTGLGLSIAEQIVTEHGGELRAENDPGSGARFTISLPAGAPPVASGRP